MLKYSCLVLDHDDTVVESEKTIGYPFFREILTQFRPGETISLRDYITDCHNIGFADLCRNRFGFTEQELSDEYEAWMEHIRTNVPEPFPGIDNVIRRQKDAGGLICVVSHSSTEIITRDYDMHFGIQPDAIYSWDLPENQRKPNPYPLQDIMDRYHLQPADLLVIDDLKLGWTMAQSAGVDTAFAAWSKADFPELAQEMRQLCRYSFDSTKQLEKFLFD